MAGKLNGVMAATTPSGWRIIISSMPRRHVFQVVALHQHGDAAGDFHVFDAAAHLASRFGQRLAVLHA